MPAMFVVFCFVKIVFGMCMTIEKGENLVT